MPLTALQHRTLVAINDYIDLHGRLNLGMSQGEELPELLEELEYTRGEVLTAVADLHELKLIHGFKAMGPAHPIVVLRVTAAGRQALAAS